MDIRTLPEREQELYNGLKEQFSVHFEPFEIKGKRIRLLRVSDLEELLERKDPFEDIESFPFWARVWESSIVLAHILAETPGSQNGRLLEIGSGFG